MANPGIVRPVSGQGMEGVPRDLSVQRENAGYIAPGQSVRRYVGKVPLTAVAQTIPLMTPPAGKTYLITDLYLSTNDVTPVEFSLVVNGVSVLFANVRGDTAPLTENSIETQIDVPQGQALSIVMPADNAKVGYFMIGGIEQSIGSG